MPAVGEGQQDCEQGGQLFQVRLKVSPTPNPNFRRVDAQVLGAGSPVLLISTVMGRF
jgi:general secretion pathway protein I